MALALVPWSAMPTLPRNYLSLTVDFSNATWNTVASHEIFTVTGRVRVVILPICTEDLAGATATIALEDDGAAAAYIAATTGTDIDSGEVWLSTTPATSYAWSSVVDRVINGADIGYTIATAALSDGTIVFHCWWDDLGDGTANVVQGAGGTL